MGKRDDRYSLEGCTELDEGYFSNSKQLETNEFTGKTEVLKRGKGSQKKSTVLVMNSFKSTTLSLISKKYSINSIPKYLKMKVIKNLTADTLDQEVKKSLLPSVELTTHNNPAYIKLKTLISKHTAHNVQKVNATKVIPWVHKAISNSKAILIAVHKGVSGNYLQNYLNEYCFKYNRRNFGVNIFNRMLICAVSYTWY